MERMENSAHKALKIVVILYAASELQEITNVIPLEEAFILHFGFQLCKYYEEAFKILFKFGKLSDILFQALMPFLRLSDSGLERYLVRSFF